MSGHTAIIDGNSPRRIVNCAQGHRCTIPESAFSDGVAASHSCPVCGLGVPKEKTSDQHHGTRRVHAQELRDHAALIRKMDEIANASGPVQTMEPTARMLDGAAALSDSHAELVKALEDIRDLEPGTQQWVDDVVPESEVRLIAGRAIQFAKAALATLTARRVG